MGRGRSSGRLRIISGRWRGRRFGFAAVPSLRPTPDRVRETLFNWLTPHIEGARVLDLFAGSGVLGFEALSRGAARAVAVENDRAVAQRLRQTARDLGAGSFEVVNADARRFTATSLGSEFNLVFIDPPHTGTDYNDLCRRLEASGLLAASAFIYVERSRRSAAVLDPPPSWQLHRSATAGDVAYGLWRRLSPGSD